MKCLKCGIELDAPYSEPLCRNCERESGMVFKLRNPSEVLELHLNYYKENGNFPNDFKLSDDARTEIKIMIYKILERGESSEVVSNTIFGYCSGYLRGLQENEKK